MHRTVALLIVGVSSCRAPIAEPPPESRIEVHEDADAITFVAIGDYGDDSSSEAEVAASVRRSNPDLVITLGDNNYPDGTEQTIDANVGKHYASFIAPYRGRYGPGAEKNRFFPSLGNHDWHTTDLEPYLDYFELPGNERYYDFVWGPVHFFAVDSDMSEPDGNDMASRQALWLRDALAGSSSPWQVVYMHHAPYSSGRHGSDRVMQWPFVEWGADAVLAGHDHHYERIERDGGLYLVNGLSGSPKVYDIRQPVEGSMVRFNETHGAIFASATSRRLQFTFVTGAGETIDTIALEKPGAPTPAEPPAPVAEPAERPEDFDAYED